MIGSRFLFFVDFVRRSGIVNSRFLVFFVNFVNFVRRSGIIDSRFVFSPFFFCRFSIL